jgi:DNA-binding FadR family transcriptional regulator
MTKRPERLADKIAEKLRSAIVGGRLRPGDALPSERELAEQYDVNRSSIREALGRLETWGLVKIRHGGATRVSDFLMGAGLELLPHLVELGDKVDPGILDDLHGIRGMVLGWCAEMAARKADATGVEKLEALVRLLSDPKAKSAALQILDFDFYQELVRISGNRVLGLFSNVVRDVYLKGKDGFAGLYARDVFDPAHHQQAVAAIRARDPAKAGAAMRAHAATALKRTEP